MLFAAFYLVCFIDKDGLYKIIMRNETYKNLPFTLSDFDLKNLSRELMQYISGKLPFLETKVTIDGVMTDFYSVRSKIHMADVKNLIINFRNISYLSIILCIFSLFKVQTLDNPIAKLKSTYIKTLLFVAILLIALIIFASSILMFSSLSFMKHYLQMIYGYLTQMKITSSACFPKKYL